MPDPRIDRLWAELSQLRVELRRISTQQIRSELTGAQTDINTLESDVASLPEGVLGYAEVTADQAGITTEADLTGLSVSVDVAAGRRILITAHARVVQVAGSAGVTSVRGWFKEGTTYLGRWAHDDYDHGGATARGHIADGSVSITPSAGAHTYKLTLERVAANGSVEIDAGSNNPAFILVEDIGSA